MSALDELREASMASIIPSVQSIPHLPRKGEKDGMDQACVNAASTIMLAVDRWTTGYIAISFRAS